MLNRSVQRESEGGEGEDEELAMKHDPGLLQRAGDEDELAMKHDAAALQRESEGGEGEDEELAMKHDPGALHRAAEEDELAMKHDPAALQRESEGGEGEEEELAMKHDPLLRSADDQPLRRAAAAPVVGLEGGPVGSDIEGRIRGKIGGGTALPASTRATMESGFGHDFSDVRVHQDGESDSLNRAMTAKAFTTGSDIFLRGDASPSDDHLMAHELTHVVQQSSGRSTGGQMSAGPANDPQEHEADRTAEAVLSRAAQRKTDETT
jgi:hypothetical protein